MAGFFLTLSLQRWYLKWMSSSFYLQRTLTSNEKSYSESGLLTASRYIVVLGEPGGGKTELMSSLADQLGSVVVTANVFGQVGAKAENSPLVIDAFDELAKVDETGIHKLLGKVQKAHPTNVIVSSRSSEWNNAATSSFEEFIGHAPLIVRLREFNEAEQRLIFENHTPGEDFAAFQAEVACFDLDVLLPNPQFLKLFADAYVGSGRHFIDKRSIFEQAVVQLAKEANTKVAKSKQTLSNSRKVQFASEVFAKLLLSGAEGIGTSEASENQMYPLLATLFEDEDTAAVILTTRLFKPGDNADQHRPVHKIVSEYCAADYLTKRIADPLDPLTISKCLSIIAPNSTVRDELRGMVGWMASLGNTHIQEATIALDPYAVLANGDPSQLDASSKSLLVKRLKYIADQDPYFRRSDFWRRFSVAGFFTQAIVDEIKPLLAQTGDGHLRDLILELLTGSPAIAQFSEELRQLVLSPTESENTRILANSCLLGWTGHDHRANLAVLIFEASETSLKVAAQAIETLGPEAFGRSYLVGFFRVCANLYPGHQQRHERTIGSRYFVKRFIDTLDTAATQWLLDKLTKDLTCTCGKQSFECDCRNGISKIVGLMLDRYFDLASPPHDPKRVWQWVENLNFHETKGSDQSKAVHILQEDDGLRQSIIAHVFSDLNDQDQIFDSKRHFQFVHGHHSGLFLRAPDYKFVVDLAFDTNNPILWSSFMARHQVHRNVADRGVDTLRRHMRKQALEKPAFMREWVKSNRAANRFERENRMPSFRHSRKMRRRRKINDERHAANIKYVQENRKLVESGRHWNCLVRFAELVLEHPDRIEREFGDEKLVRNALRSCLDFIDEAVPDLQRLAELQCASQGLHAETILYAACLEILREQGHLECVDRRLLRALRTNINMGYSAVSEEDRNALKAEIERLIFPDIASAEDFLRRYVEPQLAMQGCANPEIWWLQHEEAFSPFRSKLSIEWLGRSRGLGLGSLDTLFEIAAQYGSREELKEIIASRCAEFVFFWPNATGNEDIEQKRAFWFLRAFYFLGNAPAVYWDWLKADKDTVLMFHERSGRLNRSDHPAWPVLTSEKVAAILSAFVGQWPKVDLPSSFGTGRPKEENAYRFLTDVIWSINSDDPDNAIPVLDRLLTDARCADLHKDLKSIRAGQVRRKALRDFEPPTPQEIVKCLDHDAVVTVEGLRELLVQELHEFQKAIDGGEFNSAVVFYDKIMKKDKKLGKSVKVLRRKNENESTERIAERLNLRLQPQGISIVPEHQLKALKRSDFTATKMIDGTRRLLVTEVKGQWHDELYTAAAAQLYERYSIHPDAEQQGVYLVLWFGPDEKVAGLKNTTITTALALKKSIKEQMPTELAAFVDVFVLDVSRN